MTAYEPDLAYIHDIGFTNFVRKASPALLGWLKQSGVKDGLVVDAGCGSGVWARELIVRGYDVLGIDISPSMIRLARKKAPSARFRAGSFLSVPLPRCGAVTAIGEVVNYAFDPANGRKAIVQFFGRVRQALRPGGVFVFDIVEPGLVPGGGPQRKFLEGPDWAILLEVWEESRRKVLTRRIVSYRKTGKLYRRSAEIHRLHLYSGAELCAQLNRAGFDAQVHQGYGSFSLGPAHAVLVARKPLDPADTTPPVQTSASKVRRR